MELQKPQLHDEEEEEEEEKDVALLLRGKSRQVNGTPSAPISNRSNVRANNGSQHASEPDEEELNKRLNGNNNEEYFAASDFADGNGDEATRLLQNSVYFDNHQGSGSGYGLSGIKNNGDESSDPETNPKVEDLDLKVKDSDIQRILSTETTHKHWKNLDDEMFSSSSPPPAQRICEERCINLDHLENEPGVCADTDVIKESDQKNGVDADTDVIEEIDQEFTEIDVERVLQKQNTHDLYCPNCNSCITRRVILRRRKLKVRNIRHSTKHHKFETSTVVNAKPVYTANDQGDTLNGYSTDTPPPAPDDDNHDRQPDAFRCLSCFSLFIPTGNGFKLFQLFGDSNKNEKMRDVQNICTSKTNSFFSIFASDTRKATAGQGNGESEHSEGDGINQHASFSYSDSTLLRSHGNYNPATPVDDRKPVKSGVSEEDSIIEPQKDSSKNEKMEEVQKIPTSKKNWFFSIFASNTRKATIDQGSRASEHSEVYGTTQHNSFRCPDNAISCHGSDNPAAPVDDGNPVKTGVPGKDSLIKSQQGGLESLDHSKERSLLLEKQLMAVDLKGNMATGSKNLADHNSLDLSNQGASSKFKTFCNSGPVNSASIGPKATVISPAKALIPSNNLSSDVEEKSDDAVIKNNTGDDVIVIIEAQPGFQNVDNCSEAGIFHQSRTQMHVNQQIGPASGADHSDILKSIVYGGLVESVTSLSVVSSAAAAGAATLNILALGLANLIGGLFILGHNLGELRNDRTGAQTSEQEDRYQQLLGRRDKFSLHATIVFLSFLIFGLVPPVIYGFSFRGSNDRDLKMAAVAGSSLACIILLAVGKGYVQKPPKAYIRLVLYYLSIGVMASGASYFVGYLIKKLLNKLNLFDSSVDVSIPFPEGNPMNPGWASY